MPTTRSQANNQSHDRPQKSPSWDCENGSLPKDTPSAVMSCSASPEQSIVASLESGEDGSGEEVEEGSKQVKNARSPPWLPWQDRFLAAEVLKHQPFLATHRDTQQAWKNLAQELENDSKKKGTAICRTGPACSARFKKILAAHKQDETRSLQKTGTNEEVDEHVRVMTDLVALIDGHMAAKEHVSMGVKAKASKEQKAALELRDAAMKGMRPRNTLSDIAQLDGAMTHEKQSQRKRKRAQTADSAESDKENSVPSVAKRSRNQITLASVLQQREEEDTKHLEEACARDERRHEQLVNGFERLTRGLATLTDTIQYSMRRDSEANAQQTEVLKILSTVLQQKNN
ncbi:hypothetical protein M422DRAFT_243937 [Sphaerobolus stellatus SS14]|nr:hypothetical protein M422DRAFT_243937 [Sphaerobolus stellatus SS14]